MTLVKICGITNLEDALAAVDAGADAVGFNFYEKSPRYVEARTVRRIIEQLPESVLKVGVFVNVSEPESLRENALAAGINVLQLHGDESPEYCAELSDYSVIKAIAVGNDFEAENVLRYRVDSILLDTSHKSLRGGTGEVFDWRIAQKVTELFPRVFLAGGLSAANVVEAINHVRPYAVDTCSAVESAPGKKDHEAMRKFVRAARDIKP